MRPNENMKTKVIHLHLKEPLNGESDYYYGSLKAIYDYIPQDLIGITYKALTNAIRGKTDYENKRCTIHIGTMERKKQTNSTQI